MCLAPSFLPSRAGAVTRIRKSKHVTGGGRVITQELFLELIPVNFKYYCAHTTHETSLSNVKYTVTDHSVSTRTRADDLHRTPLPYARAEQGISRARLMYLYGSQALTVREPRRMVPVRFFHGDLIRLHHSAQKVDIAHRFVAVAALLRVHGPKVHSLLAAH